MENNVLIRTIFEYCKIKKITLDEFVEQVKDYEGERMNKKSNQFGSVLLMGNGNNRFIAFVRLFVARVSAEVLEVKNG